jgi:hypothetical protein
MHAGIVTQPPLGWVRGAELLTTVISKNNRNCQFTGGPISERPIYFEYLTVIIF